ncbi:retinal short-chain dehydrogenase reductase [Laetiporus sulphureus 93-53]|uniref:Short-chain dehydrogenase/reductase 3 n=1 Tax=Laetiporus sulphureus 93-53 TaxID=1314785 RepID=A0A165E853_9APHY|nr:retinal short-chain dehydrogenase reductase [Laetiporus sulphureus 93-53]KZT06430.1 retinal short-chain dehydrogenase reductase [Laetiporus sulphureus 93-53]
MDMDAREAPGDASPIFDNFDIDLIVKVVMHTILSPFFTFFIPVFYYFQGMPWYHPVLLSSAIYVMAVSAFWFFKWCSRLYRNQGSLLYAPAPLDWGEQIVVITGGASGMGELIANTCAVRNVTVVVLDVNPIVTENYNINYYKCDVSKWEEVEAVSKKIIEDIGHPTILINNAGVVQGKLLLDLTPEDIQQTFSVNTLAHFWTLKAFLPGMIERKTGHIVTMSSVAGMVGMARMTDYNASKAALISLHESLRYELDHKYKTPGIRTTLVMPGHVLTPLFSKVRLPTAWWYRFLVPSLPPVAVAKAVIAALDDQHSQEILMPFYANFVPYLTLCPSFVRDFGQWLSGCDYAMDGFIKVTGRRPEEGPAPSKSEKD